MASETGKQIGAVGRTDTFLLHPEKIVIREEDPKHPDHAFHMARVNPDNPAFQKLLASMREIGWQTGSAAFCYFDGKGADKVAVAATAKRRITAARTVNAERAAAGKTKPEDILVVPVVPTSDPVMAQNIENSLREDDPPLVRARRFLAARDTMGAVRAAASVGFSLAEANQAVEMLKAEPELQKLVNEKVVPLDVGVRITKKGREAAAEQLNAARDETGKVDPKKLRAAAKKVSPAAKEKGASERQAARVKVMPGKQIVEVRKSIKAAGLDDKFLALIDFFLGKKNALKDYPSLSKAILGDEE